MGRIVSAKAYRGVPIRLPVVDTVTDAGEVVSTKATWGMSIMLSNWLRMQSPATHAIGTLVRSGRFSWRFLSDGTLWFGDDTWEESNVTYELLDQSPADDSVFVATDDLVEPGTTLIGRRVGRVHVDPCEMRTTIWFERESSDS